MKADQIMKIFEDTAFPHFGGTDEELKVCHYLQNLVAQMGMQAEIEEFPVDKATIHEAVFEADGVSIPCKGYFNAGSGEVEAPFYYLTNTDEYSLSQCKGKIVMIDGYLGYWMYHDLLDHGALGFVTYDGNVNFADRDIDQRELRSFVHKGQKIVGVHINTKDAVELVRQETKTARILLKQEEYTGVSRNLVLDLPGQIDEYVAFSAHYDSVALSNGAYDNMSGSITLLGLAEYFRNHPHRYGLRIIWCGSEERGLLGSKAYVAAHEEELEKCVLNINIDMVGCIMGKFAACCTAEEEAVHYLSCLGRELGFGIHAYQEVYSSDSTPFADKGIPAISFARWAPGNTSSAHNRYDTIATMSGPQMVRDIEFITAYAQRMVCAQRCPVSRTMPDNMKEKLDCYLMRKRAPQK